ncbi:MAG: hypothetical protein L0Y70_21360 [Gemmataceae bacterium]|nr:hypothetical protein [Gemmataceae bacterium]
MPRKTNKNAVVAFKVEKNLADFLNRLPNKSAFIRKAIAAQMNMACPLCKGTGQVSRWVHENYMDLLHRWSERQCDGCGTGIAFPDDPGNLGHAEQHRLEQFFKGGPLYCDPCFDKTATCNDCGWHIAPEKVAEHHKKVHRH